MIQWAKTLVAKSDDLNSIPRIYGQKERSDITSVSLTSAHMHWHTSPTAKMNVFILHLSEK